MVTPLTDRQIEICDWKSYSFLVETLKIYEKTQLCISLMFEVVKVNQRHDYNFYYEYS